MTARKAGRVKWEPVRDMIGREIAVVRDSRCTVDAGLHYMPWRVDRGQWTLASGAVAIKGIPCGDLELRRIERDTKRKAAALALAKARAVAVARALAALDRTRAQDGEGKGRRK